MGRVSLIIPFSSLTQADPALHVGCSWRSHSSRHLSILDAQLFAHGRAVLSSLPEGAAKAHRGQLTSA